MGNATTAPTRRVRLADGRLITLSVAGPIAGFPLVYCHGAIGSPRWHVPGLDLVLERLCIRYLVVNRPGFGGSDPSPGRTVVDFARDIGEVMSILGYRRFAVVGISAGAPYALACGHALPDRIVTVGAVSPLGPSYGEGAGESVRYRLALLPFRTSRLGPTLAHACLRALGLRGQTSAAAMIDDYLVCRGEWGFDPAQLRVPVTLWHGRLDRLVPLADMLRLAAAIPGSRTYVDPDGGHFFYGRRLEEIIGSLMPDEVELSPGGKLLRAA
jgi:pimeloyl-ACP methyl ester carboxylesterase